MIKANCPNCNATFMANNNEETCCPECDQEFIVCDESRLTNWN